MFIASFVPTNVMAESISLELATRTEAQFWTETVLFSVTNVVAIFGNPLTCYAVYRKHRLRTLRNMFIIALAIADILMSICGTPFAVANLYHGRWIFVKTFCRFHSYTLVAVPVVSLNTMGIIALSRYFRVVKPQKYPLLFTR